MRIRDELEVPWDVEIRHHGTTHMFTVNAVTAWSARQRALEHIGMTISVSRQRKAKPRQPAENA